MSIRSRLIKIKEGLEQIIADLDDLENELETVTDHAFVPVRINPNICNVCEKHIIHHKIKRQS